MPRSTGRPRRRAARWGLLLVAALAVPLLWWAFGTDAAQALRDLVRSAGVWGAAAFVVVAAILIVLCAPASLIYATAGAAFGVATGTLWAGVAAVLGSSLAFGIARSALGEHVARRLARNARLDRFERMLSEHGLWLTLLLRLSVLAPIGPVSYGIGLSRIRARTFLLTHPAVLPAVFTYAYAGELAQGLLSGAGRERALYEWLLLAVGLVATAGAAWLLARAAHASLRSGAGPEHEREQPAPEPEPEPAAREPEAFLPPLRVDDEGRPRAVGVEIEFLRLQLNDAAEIIVDLFGGRVERVHERALRVSGTRLGEVHVELDSHLLGELAQRREQGRPVRVVERFREAIFGFAAREWTPSEITTEPLSCEQIVELDRLVRALGRAGAAGTEAAVMALTGVHFNPSAPTRDARLLRDYIRAYLLLHTHLRDTLHVDIARRAMRFATAYPAAYRRLVLAPDYAPDLGVLIDDYLRFNPTRNRGLDLLPLFAHIAPEQVRAATQDPRIKARPAFHFRLPNSQVGDPKWRISDAWRVWLEVERLAVDPRRLAELGERARRRLSSPWFGLWQRRLAPIREQEIE